MKEYFSKKSHLIVVALIVVAMLFFAGFYIGRATDESNGVLGVVNKDNTSGSVVDFSAFWKAWKVIDEKYVPTTGTSTERVNDQARVYGAIQGMTDALGDPYTVFFPPVESKSFAEEISGNFEGVGMEVGIRDEVLTVVAPLKNSPAERSGIKAGDKILLINDIPTLNLSVEEAIKMIRGKKGTEVKLMVSREGVKDNIQIKIVRDVIDIPTIETEIKGDVFVIRLYNFSAISSNLFRDALRKFIESGKYKLIIDLRGNPGGYLESAIDMASWFLPAGKVVVKEDFRDEEDAQVYRSKGYNIFNENLKLAILIDGGSASASEILAGALQQNGVATLVGTKSFGKGSVQELVPITDDTSLKVTVAKWLTPNGSSISEGGLKPDVEVKLDEKLFKDGVDTQLQKAIEILK